MNRIKIVALMIAIPVLAGCNMSQDHWKLILAEQSDLDICAASMDDRDGAFDGAWQARKQVALDFITERKIKCDRQKAYIKMVSSKPLPVNTDYLPSTYIVDPSLYMKK